MKKITLGMVCVLLVLLNLGCQSTKTRAVEGALIGGIIGAGAGYGIGQGSHHGGEGAGIGAATGAVAGAIVGSQIEKPAQNNPGSEQQAAYNPNQLSADQVVALTRQGVHEDVIIDRIHLTNSKFNLAGADITYLRQQGVSERVIAAMQGQ